MRFIINVSDEVAKMLDTIAEKAGTTRNGLVNSMILDGIEAKKWFLEEMEKKNDQ